MADSFAPPIPFRLFRTPPRRALIWSRTCRIFAFLGFPFQLLAQTLPQTPSAPPPASPSPATPALDSPSGLLQALHHSAKPDWTAFYRDPVPTVFPSRAQNALTLGSLYADGLLAGLAEDPQQIHNLARDLIVVAKPLGLTTPPSPKDPAPERFDRSKSLTDCADQKHWPALRSELEASQAAAEATLLQHGDRNLAELVSLGVWLRSFQILATALLEKRDASLESALSQSLLVRTRKILQSDPGKKPQEDATWTRLTSLTQELNTLLTHAGNLPESDLCKVIKTLSAMLGTPARRKTAPPSPCALE
jgi:hypothetical protein